ncbi:MAG: DUF1499 domain-containing protein [Salinisphaera sp.]|nr:DUF1499 domain-containing protein [Salinisphaera sp.]
MTKNDQLTSCPSAPHCVSSQAPADSSKHVEPFGYETSAAAARKALLATLDADDHATVVKSNQRFIHATFKTTLGFVDDVTFLMQPDKHVIDVKSQSRVGYYDFGKNRSRVEALRKAFEARLAQS